MRVLLLFSLLGLAAPAHTQTFHYTARTAAPVAESGEVRAGSITWRCAGNECRVSGPWSAPGVAACRQLAALVGPVAYYGHPGAQLSREQLLECNRAARQVEVRTRADVQISPEAMTRRPPVAIPGPAQRLPAPEARIEVPSLPVRYDIPPITRRTLYVEPPPSDRFFAIQTSGGDGDFAGNGPQVTLSATVSAEGPCLFVDVVMDAAETRADWTRGRAEGRQRIWCEPEGGAIERILSPVRATARYIDTDWQLDVVVPGHGEVDPARPIPENDGPVRAFMVIGDTDGADVGYLDAQGRPTVRRTSVQIQFNPIRVVVPVAAAVVPAGPPGTHVVTLNAQHSGFFVLPHTAGDREFGGSGPRMRMSSRLDLSDDRRSILATLDGEAEETRGGDTRGAGSRTETLWSAPPGWRINDVRVYYSWWEGGERRAVDETALGRPIEARYVDNDHEDDFVPPGGTREARRNPDASIFFINSVNESRRRLRSHVALFRAVGDTDGQEAGVRTGFQVFYQPLVVSLSPDDPARADVAAFRSNVLLDVPTGDYTNQLSGGNSCGPSAGSRMLRFYGADTTYERFKRRVLGSTNLVSDNALGTPPGTLRDRMNDVLGGFVQEVLPLGGRRNAEALARIRSLLDQGRPVIVLVGWGAQMAAGYYAPGDAANALHWVVVRGYDSRSRVFHVIDNGHPVDWSYLYLESLMDYGQDAQFELLMSIANVEKGSIIYRR